MNTGKAFQRDIMLAVCQFISVGLGKSINPNNNVLSNYLSVSFKTADCLVSSKYCFFLDDLFNPITIYNLMKYYF